ncbi:MAG: OmpA family protein [Desulfomonilia bacterium]|jgi:outer membrane protein OmpA-like peptidoglycan-associated protein|nr:OmpA family protein [Deltaproteobacteria bacterium]MDX9761861.1 OmpA family protein [Desulfomonilia bacterium]
MKKTTTFILLILVTGLPAVQSCTTDPYTRERQTSRTVWGSVIGGAAGAAAGAATGRDSESRRKRALIGLGIGALAGGTAGAYMDRQETLLRQRLEATGVSVTRIDDRIILNMPSSITFETDSAELRPQFYDVLNSVSQVLEEYEKTLVNVAGHTDSTGAASYNQTLSEKRARNVAQYLIAQGVNPTRVAAEGMGENQPVASNQTPEGRQANRRVEITLAPLTETG